MRVYITDTTLREGNQSPSLELSYEERKELFLRLVSLGVEEVEVGVPAHGEEERAYIKELLETSYAQRVLVWNRARFEDLQASLECGATKVEIAFPSSDIMIEEKLGKSRAYLKGLIKDIVPFAKGKGLYVSTGLEDVSRAEPAFLFELAELLKESGADRLRLSDTVGLLNPLQTTELVERLSKLADIEVHFHNDFGMATANVITAVMVGAKYVNCSLLGLGERCGISPMEEVVFYLELFHGVPTGIDLKGLYTLLKEFSQKYGIRIDPNKPLLGENAFTNKSSIHIDALLKSRRTYLPIDPQMVGEDMRIKTGRYSGKYVLATSHLVY